MAFGGRNCSAVLADIRRLNRNPPRMILDHPCANIASLLQNMAYQADQKTKRLILRRLGTNELFRLLSDPCAAILKKTLGLLRNLLTRPHVDQFMEDGQGSQIMQVREDKRGVAKTVRGSSVVFWCPVLPISFRVSSFH